MKFYFRKQLHRSNWLGFIRRIREYLIGRKCYMKCGGRLHVTEQLEVGNCIRERWICDFCKTGATEVY